MEFERLAKILEKIDKSQHISDYFYKYEWSWRTNSRRYSLRVDWIPNEWQEIVGDTEIYTFWEEDTLLELLDKIAKDGHFRG